MGIGASVEVFGIGTYKLDLRGGHTLLFHDVLYAPEIRRNLLSLLVLLRLGFRFVFQNNYVFLYLGTIYYGNSFISSGFMVLNIDYYNNDGLVFLLTSSNDLSNSSVVGMQGLAI